jgi:type IV pilus assembly protein PilA
MAVAACAALASGCGSKDKKAAALTAAPPDTSALWALAPESASFGIVVGDGVGTRLYEIAAEAERIALARPSSRALWDPLRVRLRALPIDPLDPASLRRAGFDPARGMALFMDSERVVSLAVLPVVDRAAMRAATGATVEKVGDRELDRLDDMVCGEAAGRYVCARTAEAIEAAATPHASPLRAALEAVPALRGAIELAVQPARFDPEPGGKQPTLIMAGARFGRGVMTMDVAFDGLPMPPVFGGGEPAPAFRQLDRGASAVARARLDVGALLATSGVPASLPVAGVDARRDVLDQLTGDVALVIGARTGLMVGVRDEAPVRRALDAWCRLPMPPELASAGVAVQVDDGRCTAELPAGVLPFLPPQLPVSKLVAEVSDGVLRVTTGDAGQSPAATVAASAHSAAVLDPRRHFVWWTRGYGGLAPAAKQLEALAAEAPDPAQVRGWIDAIAWGLAHVAEVGIAGRIEGARLLGSYVLVTHAADPDEVYRAYEAAVVRALDGDADGYRTANAELAARHADSLAGRAVAVEAGGQTAAAVVGVLAAIAIPSFVKYIKKSKTAEARVFVGKMHEGARAAFAETGKLPASAPLTPADPTKCCEKCAPDAAQWAAPPWIALGFSVDDPHYYSYRFITDGKSTLTAQAIGDLDCDGELSTFEMYGTIAGGQVRESDGLHIDKELE